MKSKNVSLIAMLTAAVVAVSNSGCGGGQSAPPPPPPISVTLTLSTAQVDQGQSVSLTATVANDSSSKGVTWNMSGAGCAGAACGTLSNRTLTSATYTAPNAVAANLSVIITATSVGDSTKSASDSVTAFPPPTVTTTSLPDGTIDTTYSQSVQATGGIQPYKWTIASGSLPSWATLNSATGTISGIPGVSEAADFTIQVADSGMPAVTSTQALSITVLAGASANASALSGHYAFLLNGFDDATGSQVAVAGSFAADGKGNITVGIEDENGPSGPILDVSFTGTYNIGSDNRGAFTINTASGPKTYALVLSSISSGVAQKARFVEFDDTTGANGTRGSGFMRLQDATAFALASITGPYAFGFAGQDATGKRNAIVGSFTADGAGTIPSGTADQNVAGTATNPSLTGTYTAPSSTNGRATMTLTPSGASNLDLSAYVVSANELLLLTTNAFSSGGVISGAMLSQTSTPFSDSSLNAPAVYSQIGVNPSTATTQSFAEIGLLSTDGKGGLTVTYDTSLGGALTLDQTFMTTYSVLTSGRVTISGWYANSNSPLRVLYLVDKNKAFFLDTSAGVGFGFIEPQAAGPFSNASLSGTLPAATAAPSVNPDPDVCGLATLDASGSFTEIASASVVSGLFVDQTTSGKYSIAANGRGLVTNITITTAGIGGAMLGIFAMSLPLFARRKLLRRRFRAFAVLCLTTVIATTLAGCPVPANQLVFYVVSPTKVVMIHESSVDHTPVVTIIEK